MERSIVAMEEKHWTSDSSTPMSKSSGSLVKIDSISIDLGIAMEKNEAGKCEHFSIRGYVAEMRKKDRKICSPFPLDGKDSTSEEQINMLPPLYVAKFRWWRCQNCLQEIGAASASEETGVVSKCCKSELIPWSTCPHISSRSDAAIMLPELKQASKLDSFEGRKSNTTSNFNEDEYRLSSCNFKREKNTEVGHTAVTGHDNGLVDDTIQETDNPTCDLTKLNPSRIQDTDMDGTVALKSKSSGLVGICEPNCRNHDSANIVPALDCPKCKGHSLAEISLVEKENAVDDEQRNVLMAQETSKVAEQIDEAMNTVKDQPIRVPSLELEEHGNVSAESDEIFAADSHCDQHHDNSSGLPRRKTRKVRLLIELLGGKCNAENDCRRVEGASSNAIADASVGLGSLSASHGEVALHENVGKGFRGPQRKRKMPQDEDWNPLETSYPNNVAKKVRALKGDSETTDMAIEISDLESEDDASASPVLQTSIGSQWTRHGTDRSPKPGKKKHEQAQVDNGYSPLVPWQEAMPKKDHIKVGNADKFCAAADTSFSKPTHDALKRGTMVPSLKSCLSPLQTERNSGFSKKKDKLAQVGQAFLMPQSNSIFGEGSSKRKDVELMQTSSEMVKLQAAHDASASIGLDLCLNSYMAAQRNEKNYIAQIEDRADPLSLQKCIPGKEIAWKNDMYVGDSRFLHKSAPEPSLKEGLLCVFNERIAQRTDIMHEQKNFVPLLADRSFSLHQKSNFSGQFKNEKTIEVQGHAEVIKKRADQRADKVLEQGTSDDILMEIVELMARNQYERGLYEDERNYGLSDRSNNKRTAQIMSFPEVHANGVMKPLPKEYPALRKSPSTIARNGIITTGENVMVPTKKNTLNFSQVNRNHFHMDQMDRNPAFTMFSEFSQTQQKPTNGAQFSASSSIGNSNTQSHEWNGDKMSQMSPPTNMQVLEAYDTCHTALQWSEEAERNWSCMTPNHLPMRLNNPQKCTTQSTNAEMRSQCSETLCKGKLIADLDLNLLTLDAANFERQKKNCDFESFKRSSAEYPFLGKQRGIELHAKTMGSLDPYSNETIPAMQLLSLMDAGMQSNTPFSVDAKKFFQKPFVPCSNHPRVIMDGKLKFLDKTLFPSHHHSKEFSGLGPGVYKASQSSKHASSAFYSKNHFSEKSCECSPAIPAADPFVSPYQNDGNFRRGTGFTGKVSFRSQEQEKAKRSYVPIQNRGRRSEKSVCTNSVSHTLRSSNPVQGKQKGTLGALDSMVFPFQRHTLEDSTKRIDFEAPSMHGTVMLMNSNSKNDVCSVNQNPADFSIPEAGNAFMICGEDLKFGKKTPRNKSGLVNVDGRKRKKVTKLASVKAHAHHKS